MIEAYVIACLIHGAWERALDLIEEFGPEPGYAPHLAQAALGAWRLALGGEDGSRCPKASTRPSPSAKRQAPSATLWLAARAVELDPTCAVAHRVLGEAQLSRGDAAAAEASLRRAAELDAEDAAARVTLALLLMDQHRLEEAKPFVEQALVVMPEDETARASLKRLRKAAAGRPALAAELHRLAARLHEERQIVPPTVSLCLIVKNEEKNLPRVIRSVRGLATEVIVVDTGSTDETVKVARSLGARVESFAWIDDFAAARNYSLSLATGEWILVLDADDEFTRDAVPALRQWLSRGRTVALPCGGTGSLSASERAGGEVDIVGLYRRYPTPGMQKDSVSIQPRLFRNGRGIRFDGAIHEQVVTADGAVAMPQTVLTATIYHHTGAEAPGLLSRRLERNRDILEASLERRPEDVRERFYLGLTYYDLEEWQAAIPHLERTIREADDRVDFLPKAYACLGNALLRVNRLLDAEVRLREGLGRYPQHPELWFCLGLVLDALGKLEEAVAAHEAALRGRFGPSLNWHDWSCREAKPHLALADLRLALGDLDGASRHLDAADALGAPSPIYASIREVIEAARTARLAAHDARLRERQHLAALALEEGDAGAGMRLVLDLLEQGEIGEARSFAATWLPAVGECPEARVARGALLLAEGDPSAARAAFRSAREEPPELPQAWRGEAEACRALGDRDGAETALLRVRALSDGDGGGARALGEFYLDEHRWSEAIPCFQESLQQNEEMWPAWLGLGAAMLRTGNFPMAIQCYQRAATLSGGAAAVRIALGEARLFLCRLSSASSDG